MEVSCFRRLEIEVFKSSEFLNSDFMHGYFKKGSHTCRRKIELVVNEAKTSMFGEKSLRTLRRKIWNSLPEDVKDFMEI